MDTIDAERILNGAASLAGLAREEITGEEFRNLRDWLSRRLVAGYRASKWPELMHWEKRLFRAPWSSVTTYANGDEVFWGATQKYYQCLRGHSNIQPTDGSGVVTAGYWAEAATSYSADNWDSGTAYNQGDQIYYPVTDLFYQVHTSGAAGTLPTNATVWGVLTEFDRYVGYEQAGKTKLGDVLKCTRYSPKVTTRNWEVDFGLSENGVQIGEDLASVVVEWRDRPSVLKGEVWDEETIYTGGSSQVYFKSEDEGAAGNFFDCVTTTAAGESPETTPAKWELVEIPLFLERYLVQGLYADWLKGDGQSDKAAIEEGQANFYLQEERQLLEAGEGNGVRSRVGQ
jgi:hypothetical protein